MLLKNEIKNIAKMTRLKLHQQEKHYIQTIILSNIYSELNDEIIFKGGTALFFFYNLNRFSDDIDFTIIKPINRNEIIGLTKRNMELIGIKNKIEKIKDDQSTFSFRISAEGPLFTSDIDRCFVNIEMSKREKVKNFEIKEIRPVYPDLLPFTTTVMAQEEICAEKIRALLTRNYARDVYDLWFLLRKGVKIDLNLTNEKLSYYHKEFEKKEFIRNLREKKDIWNSELKPLIIGNIPEFEEVRSFIVDCF